MPAKVTSLGLLILDTFLWRSIDGSKKDEREDTVLGGGGVYAIIGARMWLPPSEMGIVVDRGNDFPEDIQKTLDAFGEEMWVYREMDRPTTRALNLYTGEHRDFKYLNERTRLEPIDFPPPLRSSNWLHFVCSPTRALVIHSQLSPPLNTTPSWSPNLCYEPIPDRCTPEEWDSLKKILPHLKVFSPNHEEAAAFFGISTEEVKKGGKELIESVASKFYVEGGATGFIVIRCGAMGAYSLTSPTAEGEWTPAFHTSQDKVIDVTGGGNTFLGGLMAGLERYPTDLKRAVEMASVSASFVIEQFGLTIMTKDMDGKEVWNGEDPEERLRQLQGRR